ncbi:hypothetical protein JRC04_05340 [Mycolicibacterium sp. S2-37]|uniref:hypothetical protein n=1 Tax=Mycolicibacterium sp. S2-37 TaxID=2810297 RepID=UPI001A93F8BD|nr:hypothetical protein [Mycolicibacterium sp. S2-37]MBO0676879.1 hypothetical protein [Mycolicibacterium sp. S2-37]
MARTVAEIRAEWPKDLLQADRERYITQLDNARKMLDLTEEALGIKTGHAVNGLECACGFRTQGGYPSDKALALGRHIEDAWTKT